MNQIVFEELLEKKENELTKVKELKSFAKKLSNIDQNALKMEKGYSINESVLSNLRSLVNYFDSVKGFFSINYKEFEDYFLEEVPLEKLQIANDLNNLECLKLFDTYFVFKTFSPSNYRKLLKKDRDETRLVSVIQTSNDFNVKISNNTFIATTKDLQFIINTSSRSNFLYSIIKDGNTNAFLTSEYYLKRNLSKKSTNSIDEFEIKSEDLIYNKYDEAKVSFNETKINDLIYRFVNVNDLKFLLDISKYNPMFWSLSFPSYKYESKALKNYQKRVLEIKGNYSKCKDFLEERSVETSHFNSVAIFHTGDFSDIEDFIAELKGSINT